MKRILVLISILFSLGIGFVFGVKAGYQLGEKDFSPKAVTLTYPTGKEVLDEMNKYRTELGLPAFVVWQPLCNNIALRWDNYRENDSHEGYREFLMEYMPENVEISEILAPGMTAEETVNNWKNSPGHDIAIKNSSRVCVYSAQGLSVALLSN